MHGARLFVISALLCIAGALAGNVVRDPPAPTAIPSSWVSFLGSAAAGGNQTVWLANGVLLEVDIMPGAFNSDANVGAGLATVSNLTFASGFAATSTAFVVNATDAVTTATVTSVNVDSVYIQLSGGNIDQNSYLFVQVNNVWTDASKTCATPVRTYSRFKLATKVCVIGNFAVYRTDSTNRTLCTVQNPDKLIVGSYPVLDIDNTKFVNNTLFTNVIGPYVNGRTYTSITLSNANVTNCNYNGLAPNVWSTYFSGCRDVLRLSLPWVNHTTCGFAIYSTDSNQVTFKGTINLVYADSIGTFSGVPVTRTTQHNYDIYIQFQKQIIVTFSGLNVTSDVGIDIALTAEKYTAATGLLSVELTTAVVWSYRLDSTTTTLTTPAGITQQGAITFDASGCTTTAGSLCVQKITFQLALGAQNSTCTFDGLYSVASNLVACRDPAQTGCSTTPAAFSFSLYSGPVCTSFTVKPVVTGTLQAYAALPLSTPINSFKLGDQVYFGVNVNAGTGNTVNIRFVNVAFDDNSGAGFRYLFQNYAVNPTYSAVSYASNEPSYYFSIYLTGSVFRIAYESQATYTFNVTVDLLFAGNKKRTIETQYQANAAINTLTRVYLTPADEDLVWDDEEDNDFQDDEQVGTVADEAASLPVVVGAVVGVVAFNVLVSMLVIAFYRKMTAQNRYAQVPTTSA